MADDPEDERAIELSSITAIFPELVVDPTNAFRASIDIPVSPAKPLAVVFPPLADGAPPTVLTPPTSDRVSGGDATGDAAGTQTGPIAGAVQDIHQLSHLPPLSLQIELQDGYPAEKPPVFYVATNLSWLPRDVLGHLREQGATLWEDLGRDQVVFAYIDHLQQAAESGFDLTEPLRVPQDLKIALLDFDSKTRREKFEQETFDCGVCLGTFTPCCVTCPAIWLIFRTEPKKGSMCHRMMQCGHVFCVTCLQNFYQTSIAEGDISQVKCLAPDCGKDPKPTTDAQGTNTTPRKKKKTKEDRTLSPSELLQIPLEQEIVQRYVKLKRKKKLESDRTTIYCPRQWCQGAARSKKYPKLDGIETVESASEDEEEQQQYDRNANEDTLPPPSERLAVCEDCAFAFCSVCKSGWHGEFARCFPRKKFELTAEEKASEEYMRLHTTPCPTCMAPAQKTMGCNHMVCFKCNTHFCYLCSAWLDEDNPYTHFNTPKSPCYMRLWELEGGDGGEGVGLGFGGGPQDGDQDHDNLLAWEEEDETAEFEGDEEPVPRIAPPAPAPPRAAPVIRVVLPPVVVNPRRRVEPPAAAIQPQQGRGIPRRVNPDAGNRRRRPAGVGNVPAAGGGGGGGGRGGDVRGPARQGLQRFLEMVENDEEDEWDSDELDDEDDDGTGGNWDIPIR